MNIKRICVLFLLIILNTNNSYSNNKINLKKSNSKTARELIMEDENSNVFDAEYIHDQSYITEKINEIEQSAANMAGIYVDIDNIILKTKLFEAFNKWEGTKYKWGGASHNGIDCSALTREVFRDVFGYELPRVSVDQIKRGRKVVKREDLNPGDLLFFRPRNSVNHVAVYIGNSLFINASSSKGVVLSSLDNSYWSKYFKYGVKVDDARKAK